MIPKYLYLYISGSSAITIHYQNPNPTVVRSSLHACVLFFLPAVAFLVPEGASLLLVGWEEEIYGVALVMDGVVFVCTMD
jgi:hypothetical protein